MNKVVVRVLDVGRIGYLQAFKLQRRLIEEHRENNSLANTLLLVEHNPVFTIGIRTTGYSEEDERKLRSTGAEFYRTNRGGLITFHGPGQLVVYPILNLKHFKAGMRWYIGNIESTVIKLCEGLGLKAERSQHTGVWIKGNKVCAIGVHGSRYITSHGLAINCCTDLNWYKHIIPCGIQDKGVTSLSEELGRITPIEEIVQPFLDSFQEAFDCSYTDLPKNIINDWL